VLNLYARLMLRVGVLLVAYLVIGFVFARSKLPELLIFGALFFPIVVLAALHAVRDVSRPVRELIASVQRALEGDLSQPVALPRRDEIGFLSSVLDNLQTYLRREQALTGALLEILVGRQAGASPEALEAAIAEVADRELGAAGLRVTWEAPPAPAAAGTEASLVVRDPSGLPIGVATYSPARGGRPLGRRRRRHLAALLAVLSFHRERVRLAERSFAEDELDGPRELVERARDATVADRTLAGFELAFRVRRSGSELTDWLVVRDRSEEGEACLLVLGDTPAPGLGAALARALVAACCGDDGAGGEKPPERLAQRCNASLFDAAGGGLATFAIIVALLPDEGGVAWCPAGGSAPLLLSPGAHRAREVGGAGPLLGLAEDAEFVATAHPLAPGEALVLLTDGPPDTEGARERLARLALTTHASASELADRLADALGEADADRSVLVVRRPEAA